MSELKQKILAKIDRPTLSALSTITEEGKPWVRYCTPMADENLTIWMATFLNSRKVAQIRKNPEVHLTTGVTDMETAESYLQIQGRAEILTDE
ncbi:MAG: pyridoxamine 5'-phosphate oxidase family protein, partial [Proteobacteria bacterium]|nr:pyridoxamine 5'-phosphate oxidase family protein [Pseudomonadota bacterium]